MERWSTSEPCVLFDVMPDEELRNAHELRSYTENQISNVPTLSCQGTNTERRSTNHHGMEHCEGGWPASVDTTEMEERIKHAKRAQREDSYIAAVTACVERLDPFLRINAAVDIYAIHFGDTAAAATKHEGGGEHADALERNTVPAAKPTYADEDAIASFSTLSKMLPPHDGTAVSSLCWLCGGDASTVVVAYGTSTSAPVQSGGVDDVVAACVWDARNASAPVGVLNADAPCSAVAASPKDAHVVVGGSESGRVAFWDVRGGQRPVGTSPQQSGHCGPVASVRCAMSKGLEFFSVGADGRLMAWDARRLSQPVDIVPLTAAAGASSLYAGSCLDYDPMVAGTSKLLVGTAEGSVLTVAKNSRAGADRISARVPAHYGPVAEVTRHPAAPKTFVTVGDWGFKLFADDVRQPIACSPYLPAHLTCGKWHPVRPSVLLIGAADGSLMVWDVLHSMREPVMRLSVAAGAGLSAIAPHTTGTTVAVGDDSGALHVVRLPDVVATAYDRSERSSVIHWFEREAARERIALQAADAKSRAVTADRRRADVIQTAHDPSVDATDHITRTEADYLRAVGIHSR